MKHNRIRSLLYSQFLLQICTIEINNEHVHCIQCTQSTCMLYTLWSDRLPNKGDRVGQLFVMIITCGLDSQIFPHMNNTALTYTVHLINTTLNNTTTTQTVDHKEQPL